MRIPNACEPCAHSANTDCEVVYRVTRTGGRSLATGGFGFVAVDQNDNNEDNDNDDNDKKRDGDDDVVDSGERLFLEEVLFLHERGLLECHSPGNPSNLWSPKSLYGMLRTPVTHDGGGSDTDGGRGTDGGKGGGLSFPVYLVYAHLRRQGFRVVRHTPDKLDLLEQVAALEQQDREEVPTAPATTTTTTSPPPPPPNPTPTALRLALRRNAASASAAPLEGLAWDVYAPDARFRRSSPGLPLFCVAAASFGVPMRWDTLRTLVRDCRGIPLQIGTVSDSGQVIMFGIHDFCAPHVVPSQAPTTNNNPTNGQGAVAS